MKMETFNGYPRLCLFASREIDKDEEIRYDYGEASDSLFWRYKVRDKSFCYTGNCSP